MNTLQEAIMLLHEGDLDRSETILLHHLENGPDSEIYYALSLIALKKQKSLKAMEYIKKALSIRKTATYLNELAVLEMREGVINTAIDRFREALRFECSLKHVIHYNLATCYRIKGFNGIALYEIRQALVFRPDWELAKDFERDLL